MGYVSYDFNISARESLRGSIDLSRFVRPCLALKRGTRFSEVPFLGLEMKFLSCYSGRLEIIIT